MVVEQHTPRPLDHHYIPATAKTVHWGYYSRLLSPLIEVNSHDFVTIETLTHHAYDDHARMILGDPGAESVFHWTRDEKNVDRRGARPVDAPIHGPGAAQGFPLHLSTRPVSLRGPAPRHVTQSRILDPSPPA